MKDSMSKGSEMYKGSNISKVFYFILLIYC